MPEGIPGEGAYSVTRLDPEPQQCAGEPLRSALGLGIGVAMYRSFDSSRDDLGVAVIGCCVDKDRRYEERPLRHHPQHRFSPSCAPRIYLFCEQVLRAARKLRTAASTPQDAPEF